MKWLRGTLGSRLKKGAGRGVCILSDSCEIPVPFRVRFPKSPGRNPDFALMLSIFGRWMQGSYPNGSGTSSRSRCYCNVSSHGKAGKAQERRVLLQDDKNYGRSTNDEDDREGGNKRKVQGSRSKSFQPGRGSMTSMRKVRKSTTFRAEPSGLSIRIPSEA
jgi:hypothetical protein